MKIIPAPERSPRLLDQLINVWEESVRATHLFLTEEDICHIKGQVGPALRTIETLIIAEHPNGEPVAFMGINKDSLEMLFLHPAARGKGLGRQLLELAIQDYGVMRLCVNEQNPAARGFYEHLGFAVCSRSETDDAGNPFPLLHMILQKKL